MSVAATARRKPSDAATEPDWLVEWADSDDEQEPKKASLLPPKRQLREVQYKLRPAPLAIQAETGSPLFRRKEARPSAGGGSSGLPAVGDSVSAIELGPAELLRLANAGDPGIPALIATELQRPWIDREWLAALVVAAEATQFAGLATRQAVRPKLLAAGRLFFKSGKSRWEQVVWSAIRTYGSMLAAEEVPTLSEFLAVNGQIDARQVTLQVIQNIFRVHPPAPHLPLGNLPDRVAMLAESALRNRDVSPGKPAALATNAVAALAALGDERTRTYTARIGQLRQKWFTRQARLLLGQTSETWPRGLPASRLVAECIASLPGE